MRRLLCFALLTIASTAHADDGGVVGIIDAGDVRGCTEIIPPGGARPMVFDTFPPRGRSGYANTLVIKVEHGRGETVLPAGLQLQADSEAAKQLKSEGWVIPDQDGSAAARVSVDPKNDTQPDRVMTILELPLLALPPTPGRHTLTIPRLPIAVARASGEVSTVCTHEHHVTVEDPIAEANDPQPLPNPEPRKQREEWTTLRRAVTYGAIGLVIGAVLAFIVYRWMRRPKPVPPPPPPRPPWEIAMEQLDEIRFAGLLETERFGEYFDRVNDTLRRYLGGRYGFDGLESTTDEIVTQLRQSPVVGVAIPEIILFLEECDLVKFANVTPSIEDCKKALDAGEKIVRATIPPREPLVTRDPPPPVDRPPGEIRA